MRHRRRVPLYSHFPDFLFQFQQPAPSIMTPGSSDIDQLRRRLRQQRRELDDTQQWLAAEGLLANLLQLHWIKTCRRLAAYLPTNGEIDPGPVLDWALARRRTCYLPVLSHINGNRLKFAPVSYDTDMGINRYGIPEPVVPLRRQVNASRLDVILLPLVGFDKHGNRIGMGGGYYDRSLQLMRYRRRWRKPRLVGIAHACQEVERIESRSWDIPLDAVVTDQGIFLPEPFNG